MQDRFDFGFGRELTTISLRQALKDCFKVLGIDRLPDLVFRQVDYDARNLVLAPGRELANRFECSFKQIGHEE